MGIKEECEKFGQMMEAGFDGEIHCAEQSESACEEGENGKKCVLEGDKCSPKSMYWLMDKISDDCPFKAFSLTEEDCGAKTTEADCTSLPDCTWAEISYCDEGNKAAKT